MRRVRPARSSSATGSWMAWGTPTTRSARSGSGWVTWTRRRRRSTAPTSTGTTRSRVWPSCSSRAARWQMLADPSIGRSRPRPARTASPTVRRAAGCCRRRSTSPSRPATSRRPGRPSRSSKSIAADYERPLFQAGALTARGELLLGQDKASEASPVLGQSWRLWQTSDLPYESARARLRYAEALAAEGDAAMARRDLLAARSAFERLGATLDLERVDALLGEGGATGAAGSASRADRVTRTFMFTDIVTSTDLVGVIGDEAWSEVLRWHDRELRSSLRPARRRGGHPHRRWLLRGLRAPRRRHRVRRRHPAPAGAPSPRARLRAVGPHRPACRRGDPAGPQLHRPRRARRRPRRRSRGQGGDPRVERRPQRCRPDPVRPVRTASRSRSRASGSQSRCRLSNGARTGRAAPARPDRDRRRSTQGARCRAKSPRPSLAMRQVPVEP